ncbi:hypothetical protein ACIGXQ_37745 [Streptomyces anulatus]
MTETARMIGGPLRGQHVEPHPIQEQNGEYGALFGKDIHPGDHAPAYVRDELGQWIWQGKPWPTN